MATYQFMGAGYGLPAVGGGAMRLQKKIDIPQIIADGVAGISPLALVATPSQRAALAETGFADTEILEVFWVPKGTMVLACGVYNITGEGGAAYVDIGVTSATETEDGQDVDGWLDNHDLQTAGVSGATADSDDYGSDNVPGGELYITDGSIDILWMTAATAVAIFTVWADVAWIDIDA